jgi:hypothetical protein
MDFLQEPSLWAMGVAHAPSSMALHTIAHGVGSYIHKHRRMSTTVNN